MKKRFTLAVLLAASGAFAADNHWNGSAGSWTDAARWSLGRAPGGNSDCAVIAGGTAQISPGATPAGAVAGLALGGSSGARLEISGDAEFKEVCLADSGQSGSIGQTAGNVVVSGDATTHIGLYGTGIYNLSGGTFRKNGTVQRNVFAGFYGGSTGTIDLDGGQFLVEVADKLTLGDHAGAKGYLDISGTAQFRLGDGTGLPASGEPPGGWATLIAGDEGYGEINQSGGSLDTLYLKIADSSTTGEGSYTISGGSLEVHRYVELVNGNKATMTIEGTGSESIRMSRFVASADTILNLQLDAHGTTLMEVYGTASDPYRDAVLRGTVAVDTLPGFSAPSGSVFDVVWSASAIETASMGFTNLGDFATFDWRVVAKDNNGVPGQMFQLVVTTSKSPLDLWVEGYGLTGTDAAAKADPDGDGLDNLYEFGLGGNPADPLDSGISPSFAMVEEGGTNWMLYIYPRQSNSHSGLTYYLEVNNDLLHGDWMDAWDVVAGTGNIDSDFDAITNRIPIAESLCRKFVRLSIVESASGIYFAEGIPSLDESETYPVICWSESREGPLRIHYLQLDTESDEYELATFLGPDVDGPGICEASLEKPETLLPRHHAVAAVNANAFRNPEDPTDTDWFVGKPVDMRGLAAGRGIDASPPEENRAAFWLDEAGSPHIGVATSFEGVVLGVGDWGVANDAGNGMLLENGTNIVTRPGDRHPRSAVGVDASGRWVTFVVVDGRQEGYSIGATLDELAEIVRQCGCSEAINMDGGGSSVMIVADGGVTRTINSPSDGQSRPVPAMLGIRRKVRFQPGEGVE